MQGYHWEGIGLLFYAGIFWRDEPNILQPAVQTAAPIFYRPTNTQMLVYLSRLLMRR